MRRGGDRGVLARIGRTRFSWSLGWPQYQSFRRACIRLVAGGGRFGQSRGYSKSVRIKKPGMWFLTLEQGRRYGPDVAQRCGNGSDRGARCPWAPPPRMASQPPWPGRAEPQPQPASRPESPSPESRQSENNPRVVGHRSQISQRS